MIEHSAEKMALILGYLATHSPAPGKAIFSAVPEISGEQELRTLLGEMCRSGEIEGETLPLTDELRARWSFAAASSKAKFYRVVNGRAVELQPETSAPAAETLDDMLPPAREQPEPADWTPPAEPAPIETPAADEPAPCLASRFFVTSNWQVVVEDSQGRYAEIEAYEAITLLEFLHGVRDWLESAP